MRRASVYSLKSVSLQQRCLKADAYNISSAFTAHRENPSKGSLLEQGSE
jgi:hypothetical protein